MVHISVGKADMVCSCRLWLQECGPVGWYPSWVLPSIRRFASYMIVTVASGEYCTTGVQ